jgi:hypothetical protein
MDKISPSSNYVEVSKSPFIAMNAEILMPFEYSDSTYYILNKLKTVEVFLTKDATVTLQVIEIN